MDSSDSIAVTVQSSTEKPMVAKESVPLPGTASADALLSIVKGWKIKCADVEKHAFDPLITSFDKGFDLMSIVIGQPYEEAKRALEELNDTREKALKKDKKFDLIRSILYGFVQSLHLTVNKLVEEKNELNVTNNKLVEDKNGLHITINQLVGEKHGLHIKINQLVEDKNELNITINQLVEERNELKMTIENLSKVEEAQLSPFELPLIAESMSDSTGDSREQEVQDGELPSNSMEMEMDEPKVDDAVEETDLKIEDNVEDQNPDEEEIEDKKPVLTTSSKTIEVQKKTKRASINNGGKNTLKCMECEFTTSSSFNFVQHLKDSHSKTMGEAGLVFKCDCGKEAQSRTHCCKCSVARLSIAKTNSPIIRKSVKKAAVVQKPKEEPKETVPSPSKKPAKCAVKGCNVRPSTACGYVKHINKHHGISIKEAGIAFLRCRCGLNATSNSSFSKEHTAKCGGRNFTVVKKRIVVKKEVDL